MSSPQKRQRFVEARGESAATVELLNRMDLVSDAELERFLCSADCIAQC